MAERGQTFREGPSTSYKTNAAAWPGAWLGGALAFVSGLACWFSLFPQLAADNRPQSAESSLSSEIAEVLDPDLAGALSTMNLPGSTVARLQKGRTCGDRLAWVTVSLPNDDTGQTARLRSGNYFSPTFTVTKMPARVAIPYPAPYETGQGILTVIGASSGLSIALSPAWHIPANTTTATHTVTWHPIASCTKP